jgi:hypothetical protein
MPLKFQTFDSLLNRVNATFTKGTVSEYNSAAKDLNEYIGWQALRYLINDNENRNSRKKTKTVRKS